MHENAQQEGAPAGRRHREEPEDGHISLSRLDYKTGHTAKPQSPKHTDDVVDDVERRCIAPPKMANGQPKTLVPTRKQELHTRKNKTLEIGAIANTLSIH